jgi:hypothetical protein
MFKTIDSGTQEDIQGLICHLPPVGYVYNLLTGQVEKRGVYARSPKKDEQYWEPTKLPKDYTKLRDKEIDRQSEDKEHFDPNLEQFRQQEWDRRLNGFWFKSNGSDVYVTGLHYFYLCYWNLDTGLPKYRDTDRKYFYFLQYCIEDPECFGMVEITKRRQGKTFRGGVFLYEYTSRTNNARAGIQSKTGSDAKEVFRKAVIQPFKKLPDFFVPVYDQSKGLTPTSELRFYQTTVKGKKANQIKDEEELESAIDWKTSEAISYDGQKIQRYLGDEVGKTAEVNVWERYLVTRYCHLDDEGKIIGKALLTTTVEDMDQGGAPFKKIWDNSDQIKKSGKRTPSGLYRYFCPADETRYYDKFGHAHREKALDEILEERKLLANDTRALSSVIRKEPLSWEEAFRIDGSKCLYDAMKLNERMDRLSWKENITTRGNFVWENGERDTRVVWEPNRSGRWEVVKLFENEQDSNKIARRGESYYSNNTGFVMGVDPVDHNQTQDGRRSNGAALVLQKYNSVKEDDMYNYAFVCKYIYRPESVQIFYEDMIKTAVYYGCQILFENQKIGMMHYFNDRGYSNFLMWLPERTQPGIAASPKTHQHIAELTESYINEYYEKVYFKDLINDWLEFDISNTTAYDAAMAAGYALIADQVKQVRRDMAEVIEVKEYFKPHKINNSR